MLKKLPLLILLCLLTLPACKKATPALDTTDSQNKVAFRYGNGSQTLVMKYTLSVLQNGTPIGPPMPMGEVTLNYETKRKGERVFWAITISDQVVMSKRVKGVCYSATFNTDLWGENRQDLEELDSVAPDKLRQGQAVLKAIGLPHGTFALGSPSLRVFNASPSSDELTITLPDPDVRYIFRDIRTAEDGTKVYAFDAQIDGVQFKQAGKVFGGSIQATALMSDSMLPLSEECTFEMVDPTTGMTMLLKGASTTKQ